jgi:hypothetical protein
MFFNELGDKWFGFQKEAAEKALKANEIAAKGLYNIFGLQMAAAEERFNAAAGLAQDALGVRDPEAAKDLGPRGLDFTRESFEKFAGTNKEVLDVFVKTGEELAQLAPVNQVKKAAKAAKTA